MARGGGAKAARREELTEQLLAAASELEALGLTRDEIAQIIKEGKHD